MKLDGCYVIGHCRTCAHLVEALTHQLFEMERVTLQHMKGTSVLVPEVLHFLLPEPEGLVTVVYPAGVPDSQLETQRKVTTDVETVTLDNFLDMILSLHAESLHITVSNILSSVETASTL